MKISTSDKVTTGAICVLCFGAICVSRLGAICVLCFGAQPQNVNSCGKPEIETWHSEFRPPRHTPPSGISYANSMSIFSCLFHAYIIYCLDSIDNIKDNMHFLTKFITFY